MNILLLNTQMEPAGAQKALLELARGLQSRGHSVTIATMYDKANYIPVFQERYGLDIINLQMKQPGERNPLAKALRLVRGIWRLYRLMRQHKIQIVQTFSHYSNILGPVIAWLARVPVRLSSQRMSLKGSPGWLLQLDRRVANSSLICKMVSVSQGTRRFSIQEQGIKAEKIITIHNGIDLDRFSPAVSPDILNGLRQELGLTDIHPIIITVARLHPQKGHRFLVEIIPQILNVAPQAQFLFVGEGGLQSELQTLVSQAGLDDTVHFLGVRQDIPKLLALSDLFVLPSLWEGLPNSVLEAMAVGVPVVATNVDGCPEVILDGETGILVPPSDPGALAKAICRLLQNEALRASMTGAARARVASVFSQDANISAYVDLYQNLVTERA